MDSAANSILEHIAGIDDFEVAKATYRAAVARWPAARITLRQGARMSEEKLDRRVMCPEAAQRLFHFWLCHGRIPLAR